MNQVTLYRTVLHMKQHDSKLTRTALDKIYSLMIPSPPLFPTDPLFLSSLTRATDEWRSYYYGCT